MAQAQPSNPAAIPASAVPVIVALGIGAGCIPALQPILLNLMLGAGRLTIVEMGRAAMAEAAGMAIATTLAAFFLPPRRLRLLAVASLLAAAAANGLTAQASGSAIIALRFANGCASGLLLWLLVGMFARQVAPARLFAIYVTAQSATALALSFLMTRLVVPLIGFGGGYLSLALLDLILLGAVLLVPPRYPEGHGSSRGVPPAAAWVALLAVAAYLAGIMALWVYAIPLLLSLGFAQHTADLAVSVALGAQLVGGLAAAVVAARLSPPLAWAGGAVAAIAAIVLLFSGSTAAVIAALATFGFCWMFVPPFQMPVLMQVDPSMRGAMLIGSAQLGGSSLGPLFASGLVSDQSKSPAATVALACLIASLVMLPLAVRLGQRTWRPAE